jgi:hypothetical protein
MHSVTTRAGVLVFVVASAAILAVGLLTHAATQSPQAPSESSGEQSETVHFDVLWYVPLDGTATASGEEDSGPSPSTDGDSDPLVEPEPVAPPAPTTPWSPSQQWQAPAAPQPDAGSSSNGDPRPNVAKPHKPPKHTSGDGTVGGEPPVETPDPDSAETEATEEPTPDDPGTATEEVPGEAAEEPAPDAGTDATPSAPPAELPVELEDLPETDVLEGILPTDGTVDPVPVPVPVPVLTPTPTPTVLPVP